ncbi:MAG: peroxiredoxin family protein [Candidatus Nanohaloarchaea archaeon]|jgi:peroxiredoxin family protein
MAPEIEELAERIEKLEEDEEKALSIIVTKGELDEAYPALILGSTAASFGWDVNIFFTFYGLEIVHEDNHKNLSMSPLGNTFFSVPNIISIIPGMEHLMTWFMKRKMNSHGVASVEELVELSLEAGIDFQACQMTMELFGYEDEELLEGVKSGVGAASALNDMSETDMQLLI